MTPDFQKAHIAGVERIAAWSDVLDVINVFPVADGDTGRNLITSLTPLRYLEKTWKIRFINCCCPPGVIRAISRFSFFPVF